jgi:hypothetical protein
MQFMAIRVEIESVKNAEKLSFMYDSPVFNIQPGFLSNTGRFAH